jgi:penicillin-binding protein 1C
VLAHYLRIVPFGNNSHGVAHAARFYFDKPASDLSWAEIALLTALPQAPTRMNPLTEAGRARAAARGERVLAYLAVNGVMPPRDAALARQQLQEIRFAERPRRPDGALHLVLRLERSLGGASAWLGEHQEARVFATADLGIQRMVEALMKQRLAEWRQSGADEAAAIVVDRESREVLALVGSAGYFAKSGAIDFSATSRSPGSTLKPFLYARGLEEGVLSPDRLIVDEPTAGAGIENADRLYLGPLLPRQALANSRNAPAAALVRRLGLGESWAQLRGLGIHDGSQPARRYGLGLAIGALPTTLERLVRAYGALANDGIIRDLVWWKGEDVAAPVRVISEAAARQVTLFLSDPMARLPSFPRLGPAEFEFPVAVKTGTSQDYRDAWTVAYSPRVLVGVWVGRADAGPMRALSGMSAAAPLAQDILLALEKRSARTLPDLSFPAPRGTHRVEVCVGAERRACFSEHVERDMPREPATPVVLIDRLTGAIASQDVPADRAIEVPILDAPGDAAARRPTPVLAAPRIAIVTPLDNTRVLLAPDAPGSTQTIALRAAVRGPFQDVTWYVDGHEIETAPAAQPVRWPIALGRHRLRAVLAGSGESSEEVTLVVE